MVLSLPQSYIVKPFATILKDLPQPCWHWLTGGTFDSATGGTFQSDTDGTFNSDIPGTFESDMGGTFKVLQSDKAKLRRILEDMDLMGPWQAFGCVLVEKLGMPAEEFPFYDTRKGRKVRKIVRRILTEGNFGHEREMYKNRSGEGYLKRKCKSLYLHTTRSLDLFFLFPSHVARQYWSGVRTGVSAVWRDLRGK